MVKLSRFGAEMREWRKQNLLSQRDFALAIGVVVRTIQGIEAGEHKPSFNVYRKFRELKERYSHRQRVSKLYLQNPHHLKTPFRRSRTPQIQRQKAKIATI